MDKDNSFFTFNFALLDFDNFDNKRYKYNVEGLNDNWIEIYDSKIQLNKLPYGEYHLKVKVFLNGSYENGHILEIPISVPPPFYLSYWFFGLVMCSIIGFVFLFFRQRTIVLEKQQKILEQEIAKANKELSEKYALISEQKTNLEKINYTKDRIFAIIGHDLRKPALAFRGITKKVNYLLKKQDFKTLDRLGKGIEEDAFSLNKLIDNLLNWALTQRDVMPYHPEDIPLDEIVEEILSSFHNKAGDKELQFISQVPENLSVYSDPDALQTIIRNLVDNAIKYTPKGGYIRINAIAVKEAVKIQVKDSGVGMSSRDIQSIFLLEKHKSQEGTEGEKGTGLGMHIVSELVKINKGDIEVVSELGGGTSFNVHLPINEVVVVE